MKGVGCKSTSVRTGWDVGTILLAKRYAMSLWDLDEEDGMWTCIHVTGIHVTGIHVTGMGSRVRSVAGLRRGVYGLWS
jgi:hypothetical protein